MESVKLNIIESLININLYIGRKLTYYQAKYTTSEEVNELVKKNNIDLRSMSNRMKNIMLHDQDIIDSRRAICDSCEHKVGLNCKICKCFISAKTKVATTSCPINKWGKEYHFIKGEAVNGSIAN